MKRSLLLILTTLCISSQASADSHYVRDCADCPELAIIEPATFQMGRDDGEPGRFEGPVRTITLANRFAIGRYEVTIAEFGKFVATTGYNPGSGCAIWDGTRGYLDLEATWQDSNLPGTPKPDWPVVCVSWSDAQAYLDWISQLANRTYRLPSEAEWEYLASEGTGQLYPWGNTPHDGCSVANMYDQSAVAAGLDRAIEPAQCNDGQPYVASVGSLAPNAFGLYDIIGNVWEWVADCYEMPYPTDQGLDGRAVGSPKPTECNLHRRGNRGGSWTSAAARHRVTFRGRDPGFLKSQAFGFRVARDD